MIETFNLASKYTRIFSFRKYNFSYQDPLSSADVSVFLQKIFGFFDKNSTFTQNNSVRALLEIF